MSTTTLADRLGMALFASLVAAIQLPLAAALVGFFVTAFASGPIMGLWYLAGWHGPRDWTTIWHVIGWLLLALSFTGAINATVCSLRGRDNWLFALSLTQDRWEKPTP
jgi:ascorbate-specific PTS system EIIC-type component UlaA